MPTPGWVSNDLLLGLIPVCCGTEGIRPKLEACSRPEDSSSWVVRFTYATAGFTATDLPVTSACSSFGLPAGFCAGRSGLTVGLLAICMAATTALSCFGTGDGRPEPLGDGTRIYDIRRKD